MSCENIFRFYQHCRRCSRVHWFTTEANVAQKVSSPLAFHFTTSSSPASDCWRLRFSLHVDIVRLINLHIIIIIIIIIIIVVVVVMPPSVGG